MAGTIAGQQPVPVMIPHPRNRSRAVDPNRGSTVLPGLAGDALPRLESGSLQLYPALRVC